MRVIALIALFLAAMVAHSACAEVANRSETDPATVRGILLEVENSSLTRVERIRLRDERSQEWVFRVAEDASDPEGGPVSAGHLRQHMVAGEPVTVFYRQTNDGLVAVKIAD